MRTGKWLIFLRLDLHFIEFLYNIGIWVVQGSTFLLLQRI